MTLRTEPTLLALVSARTSPSQLGPWAHHSHNDEKAGTKPGVIFYKCRTTNVGSRIVVVALSRRSGCPARVNESGHGALVASSRDRGWGRRRCGFAACRGGRRHKGNPQPKASRSTRRLQVQRGITGSSHPVRHRRSTSVRSCSPCWLIRRSARCRGRTPTSLLAATDASTRARICSGRRCSSSSRCATRPLSSSATRPAATRSTSRATTAGTTATCTSTTTIPVRTTVQTSSSTHLRRDWRLDQGCSPATWSGSSATAATPRPSARCCTSRSGCRTPSGTTPLLSTRRTR